MLVVASDRVGARQPFGQARIFQIALQQARRVQRARRQQYAIGPEFAAVLSADTQQVFRPFRIGDEIADGLPGQDGKVRQGLHPLQQGVLTIRLQISDRGEGIEMGGFFRMRQNFGVQSLSLIHI